MNKYIITGKTSQETAASMLNKPQNRKEVTEPLALAFGAKYVEFLYLNHPDFDFMCVVMAKNDEDMTAVSNLIYASHLTGLEHLKQKNGKIFFKWHLKTWHHTYPLNKSLRRNNCTVATSILLFLHLLYGQSLKQYLQILKKINIRECYLKLGIIAVLLLKFLKV